MIHDNVESKCRDGSQDYLLGALMTMDCPAATVTACVQPANGGISRRRG